MKSLLILALALALAAAAFFTRPSQASFHDYILAQENATGNAFDKLAVAVDPNAYVNSYTYNDRFLWVTISKNGKPVYTGAFSHWFAAQ